MKALPSTTWRMLSQRTAGKKLPKGLDVAWTMATGSLNRLRRRLQKYTKQAEAVLQWDKHYRDLSDARLREEALEFRATFRRGRDTREDIIRAFALIREAASRQLGEKHFPVQIAGAFGIADGCIAEMATGEGKTLTATLPATVAGWRGKGCHVVTFNDFLAQRDADWMRKLYDFCGVSVAHIQGQMPPQDRQFAYQADITYCTNKEVTADFLRDRLSLGRLQGLPMALLAKIADGVGSGTDRVVQRGLNYAIIDEADSILIDEAVTPLIISHDAPNDEQVEAFQQAVALSEQLEGPHFKVNQRYREVELTSSGKRRLAELGEPMGGLWRMTRRSEELVVQALTARFFYTREKQYVVDDGKVVIVDEFTGRPMPDRTWREGLHQAIEAKEHLTVNPPKDTFARVSFQRFFRLYRKLGGMTGTAAEGWREFWQIYSLPLVVIPTNRPCVRQHLPDRVYATEDAKWRAIVEEIQKVHAQGRPLLIGTRSVRASEHLSQLLTAQGLEHQVLNAFYLAQEAQIVAEAGQPGRITVATNMAGRGTDIKLGKGMASLGGLCVIATERHEAGRIDRQLYGRAGRQGDPGSAQAIVSLEDELLRRYTPNLAAQLRRRYGHGDSEISNRWTRWVFDVAQKRAERLALRQRKGVLRTDDWLDEYLGFAGSEK